MAAPGTAIVENERDCRDGQHWGRHLPHGVAVARFESRVSKSGDRAPIVRNEINSRSCDEKRIYIKF